MTSIEYLSKKAVLFSQYRKAEKQLEKEMVESIKIACIEDIITNGKLTIKIKNIGIGAGLRGVPYPVYFGVRLKNDLTEYKQKNFKCIHEYGNEKLIKKITL